MALRDVVQVCGISLSIEDTDLSERNRLQVVLHTPQRVPGKPQIHSHDKEQS